MAEELHYDVTTARGDFIRVRLSGSAANVLVMEDGEYENYRNGRTYNYYGGYYTRTPVIIRPGVYGKLNVVINLGGLPGSVSAVVHVVTPGRRSRGRR
jgi:hypothetical protein